MLGNIQGKLVESAARCIQILRMLLHVACMHLHTHVRASLDVGSQAPTCSRCMAGAADQDEHQDSAKKKSVYSVLVALTRRNFHINGKVLEMANRDVVIFRGNQCHNAAAVPVNGTRTLGLHLYMGAGAHQIVQILGVGGQFALFRGEVPRCGKYIPMHLSNPNSSQHRSNPNSSL